MEQQPNIPDFMKKYHQGSDYEGQAILENLGKQYQDERATFLQTTFVQKQAFQRDWNKLTGQSKQLTVDEALKPMQAQYNEQAKKIATAHGYQEQQQGQDKQDGQQKNPDAKPQQDRNDFLQKLRSQREQTKPTQQQKAPQSDSSSGQKPPQTDREKFTAKLNAMKQEQQHITHKPKL